MGSISNISSISNKSKKSYSANNINKKVSKRMNKTELTPEKKKKNDTKLQFLRKMMNKNFNYFYRNKSANRSLSNERQRDTIKKNKTIDNERRRSVSKNSYIKDNSLISINNSRHHRQSDLAKKISEETIKLFKKRNNINAYKKISPFANKKTHNILNPKKRQNHAVPFVIHQVEGMCYNNINIFNGNVINQRTINPYP